ncbi:ThaI family type II restriction endonuclease [Cuniculiplasma sp. SKW3]|uniref:ThaI family type II restriction endonuclease n=1 Tax=Cuniculiplasma sp. SKW3 TaxID=3400170 RepID=UPI003FD5AC18
MDNNLVKLFNDESIILKIRNRLPYLFQLAELESSRAGKVGMQVGSKREEILTALLIYNFGERNVETNIPITESEIDVKLFGNPISIKTISGREPNGIKLIWTVDAEKAKTFLETWYPKYDMLLAHINWDSRGALYYLPIEVQLGVFNKLGREEYIKLPKKGTNPRGIELSNNAIRMLIDSKEVSSITIDWKKQPIEYSPFKRWVEMWGDS